MRRHVKGNVSWIGFIDWELKKFHGEEYNIDRGSSQNVYLIEEEKTVLVDTVWIPHSTWFVDNLKSEIDLKKIDYIIAHHGECDHSGSLVDLMEEIPDTPIYCTANAVKSIEGQYGKRGWNFHVVKTGDTLDVGNGKTLTFVEMPMLHWPDSMASFLSGDNILFSMDAFGQHIAVDEMFNDKADMDLVYREALRYFVNILNPFAPFVTRKLAEIEKMNLPIEMICPSHGVIWRDDPMQIVKKYAEWAQDVPEDQVTICYATMWNGTEQIARAIADRIYEVSPDTVVKLFNVGLDDKNTIMTEVFKSKAIAVGSSTEVNNILSEAAQFMTFLKSLKFKGKKAGAFGCYGWSGESPKILKGLLADAGFEVIDEMLRVNWAPHEADLAEVPAFVDSLLAPKADAAPAK